MEPAYFHQKSWILTKYFDELSLHHTSTSTSDYRHNIHIPDCEILNSKNMTTLETEWRDNFPKSKRNYIIGQIVKSVIPEPDAEALKDKRIKDLISHARLVEKKFFDMAHDREDYYHYIARKICYFKKEIEKRKRMQRQNIIDKDSLNIIRLSIVKN